MRYTVTIQRIDVVGYIWQPGAGLCAQTLRLTPYDMENLGDPRDREAVARWIDSHSGDFSSIVDFRADFDVKDEHIVHDWTDEENGMAFSDAMFPSDD